MKLTLVSDSEATDPDGNTWVEVGGGRWVPENAPPVEPPVLGVHPALARVREARQEGVEPPRPEELAYLAGGSAEVFRHALIEAGYDRMHDTDPLAPTCAVCGIRFEPAPELAATAS